MTNPNLLLESQIREVCQFPHFKGREEFVWRRGARSVLTEGREATLLAEGAEGFAPRFVERPCLSGRILRNIMVFRRVNPPVARPVHRRADSRGGKAV